MDINYKNPQSLLSSITSAV